MDIEKGGHIESSSGTPERNQKEIEKALLKGIATNSLSAVRAAEGLWKAADESGIDISSAQFLEAIKESSIFGKSISAKGSIEHAIRGLFDAYTDSRQDKYVGNSDNLKKMLDAFRAVNPEEYDKTVAHIRAEESKREKERSRKT